MSKKFLFDNERWLFEEEKKPYRKVIRELDNNNKYTLYKMVEGNKNEIQDDFALEQLRKYQSKSDLKKLLKRKFSYTNVLFKFEGSRKSCGIYYEINCVKKNQVIEKNCNNKKYTYAELNKIVNNGKCNDLIIHKDKLEYDNDKKSQENKVLVKELSDNMVNSLKQMYYVMGKINDSLYSMMNTVVKNNNLYLNRKRTKRSVLSVDDKRRFRVDNDQRTREYKEQNETIDHTNQRNSRIKVKKKKKMETNI